VVVFNFENAEVTHNNLGGVGPGDGDEYVMYKGIGSFNGDPIDMKVVTHNSDYQAGKPYKTGLEGKSGQINVKIGSVANMTFTFLDDVTQQPVTLPAFYITIFDLDWGPAGNEVVEVKGYESLALPLDPEFDYEEANGSIKATSTMQGNACDNPTDPEDLGIVTCKGLTVDTKRRSFSVLFRHQSSFDITFSAPAKKDEVKPDSGRNLQFAGTSALSDQCS